MIHQNAHQFVEMGSSQATNNVTMVSDLTIKDANLIAQDYYRDMSFYSPAMHNTPQYASPCVET